MKFNTNHAMSQSVTIHYMNSDRATKNVYVGVMEGRRLSAW